MIQRIYQTHYIYIALSILLTVVYPNTVNSTIRCSELFASDASQSRVELENSEPDQVAISFGEAEVLLDRKQESMRFYRLSRTMLSFGLQSYDRPEMKWPKQLRLLARRFFQISADHDSRARFFFNFLVLVAKDLNDRGSAAEKNSFIKTRRLPERLVVKNLTEQLKSYGFKVATADEVLSSKDFQDLIASGTVIIDAYFEGDQHGVYTHLFQILEIASTLDAEFGIGSTLAVYKSMATANRLRKWDRYFDDTNGSPYSPENYNEVLQKFLRF